MLFDHLNRIETMKNIVEPVVKKINSSKLKLTEDSGSASKKSGWDSVRQKLKAGNFSSQKNDESSNRSMVSRQSKG